MNDETLSGIILIIIVMAFFGFIGLAVYSDRQHNKNIENCLKGGNVPIHEYCVRPGSFINMDEKGGSF